MHRPTVLVRLAAGQWENESETSSEIPNVTLRNADVSSELCAQMADDISVELVTKFILQSSNVTVYNYY